jgi:hypothetical protein
VILLLYKTVCAILDDILVSAFPTHVVDYFLYHVAYLITTYLSTTINTSQLAEMNKPYLYGCGVPDFRYNHRQLQRG